MISPGYEKNWRTDILNTILKNATVVTITLVLVACCKVSYARKSVLPDTINLTVGLYQNPPKIYTDSSGAPAGIFIKLIEEIALQEGWNLDYYYDTWENCLAALENQTIDIMPDVAFNFDRYERYDFNKIPVLKSWSQVYSKSDHKIISINDMEDMRVAVVKGSVQEEYLDQLTMGFKIHYQKIPEESFDAAFYSAMTNVADAAVSNIYFGETMSEKYGLIKTPVVFDAVSLHFAVKKNENSFVPETIDSYLATWKNDPGSIYYKLLGAYMNTSSISTGNDRRRGFLYLILAAIIALTSAAVIIILRKQLHKRNRSLSKSEHSLHYEKDKFRQFIEYAPFGVFIADEKGWYMDANSIACELSGYSKKELLNMRIADVLDEESVADGAAHFKRVITDGKATGVFQFRTKKGEKRHWSIRALKITNHRFIGFANDITDEINLHSNLEMQVEQKTQELQAYISDLEKFREATIERELRMEELRSELKKLREQVAANKKNKSD